MSARSIDDLLRDELQEIARLQGGGLSRYEALRSLDLDAVRELDGGIRRNAVARRPGPMRWGLSVERSVGARRKR